MTDMAYSIYERCISWRRSAPTIPEAEEDDESGGGGGGGGDGDGDEEVN